MKPEEFRKSIKCRVLWSQNQSELFDKRKRREKVQKIYGTVEKYVRKELENCNNVEMAIKRVLDESQGIRMLCPELNNPEIHRIISRLLREKFYSKAYNSGKKEAEENEL